jgi:hypothetical protein
MKSNTRQKGITQPLLKDLVKREKANSKLHPKQDPKQNPKIESTPENPPDLYQDSGGGYNADLVFPQP